MKKRVTVMIDDEVSCQHHAKQAKYIQKTNMSYSFSRVINDTLKQALNWFCNVLNLVIYKSSNLDNFVTTAYEKIY